MFGANLSAVELGVTAPNTKIFIHRFQALDGHGISFVGD